MDQGVYIQSEPRGPSITIEVAVTTNGQQRIPFPDINQLRSDSSQCVILKGLRLVTTDTLARGFINGSVIAPLAELQKIGITLYAEGWEKGQTIPALFLNPMATPAGTMPFQFNPTYFNNWKRVDWPKSYLQYANGTLSANAPYVFMLEVQYLKLNSMGTPIEGPS